ncbi:MAG TPA: SCO family protein [Pyrinomonadaceae bacterium]|nr:SCO family protein [Pyrinomonadaceae bacterium]
MSAAAAVVTTAAQSEEEFANLVDALAENSQRQKLVDLLREDHPVYEQRGAATVVQMRGWVLLALGRVGVTEETLLYVLEELDTGVDPYLVAASASALRSYPNPNSALVPYVMRALTQIRYHDDPVSFQAYGEYGLSSTGTSPVRELLVTLAWLGRYASSQIPELEAVVKSGGLSKKALLEANRTIEVIRNAIEAEQPGSEDCCSLPTSLTSKFSWSRHSRRNAESLEQVVFEDQDSTPITFKDFFHGHPSIVVFFYTRCGNPLKCSLTVTKLARVQKLLESRELSDQIHTAAISYDPAFDLADRLRRYGQNRGVRMDANHRLLRSPEGLQTLRNHFKLGVNFIESLVNRHRVEAYVLDANGRIAASFERLHWDEQELVNRAVEVLREGSEEPAAESFQSVESEVSVSPSIEAAPPINRKLPRKAAPVWATLASLGFAFFPKCPICWAAYLSVFGIAGLNQIPYSPWLQPILFVVMLVNLVSVWLRGWATGRLIGPYLVTAGALIIVLSRMNFGLDKIALGGVVLTLAGSMLSALGSWRRERRTERGGEAEMG